MRVYENRRDIGMEGGGREGGRGVIQSGDGEDISLWYWSLWYWSLWYKASVSETPPLPFPRGGGKPRLSGWRRRRRREIWGGHERAGKRRQGSTSCLAAIHPGHSLG